MPTKEEMQKFRNPFPATDIIIRYSKDRAYGIVLIERKNPPYGLALPGGFAEYGISLEDNAVKEAKEETGLDVKIIDPEHPLCVHSDPKRDPRAHILSITYIADGHGTLKAGDDAKKARLYTIGELEEIIATQRSRFAFPDHADIIKEYLKATFDPRGTDDGGIW